MDVNQYVLVQGARQTRGALTRWNEDPWPLLRSWSAGALVVATILLGAVWLISLAAQPDLTPISIPGITAPPFVDITSHSPIQKSNCRFSTVSMHGAW